MLPAYYRCKVKILLENPEVLRCPECTAVYIIDSNHACMLQRNS